MKIGYLCSDVDVQLLGHEGCSVHIREFTNALVEAGHDVFIICNWLGDFKENLPRARVYQLEPQGSNRVIWENLLEEAVVQNHFLDRDIGSVLWNTLLQIEGPTILERERPAFLYERYSLFGNAGTELSRRFGIPLILELNDPLCDQQYGYHKFTMTGLARKLERQVIREAEAIVALTSWLSDWAVGLGADRDRIHMLPNAVSRNLFGGEISDGAVRGRLDLDGLEVIGFVGGFHRWHDIAGLIDAFKELFEANPERRLLLVGDGEARKALKKKARKLGLADVVLFTGKVPHHEVAQHIAAMDIAVVPYKPIDDFFFSPMKMFECMAVGRPTVAADLGQISEVLEHGETGWLYPPGNNDMLVEGITALLEDRRLASRIGSTAREYVLNHHTWEKVTAEVVNIATGLIGSRQTLLPPPASGDPE